MLPEDEVWKVVPSNRNYAVSNWGRVKRATSGRNTKKGKILRVCYDKDKYKTLTLSQGGKGVTRKVHSLVAEAFIGRRAVGMQVNHRNGNKSDNRLTNLEYVTPMENIHHSMRIGLKVNVSGEEHGRSRLTEEQVREIFYEVSNGVSESCIANRFNVNRQTINKIRNGATWKHLNLIGALTAFNGTATP